MGRQNWSSKLKLGPQGLLPLMMLAGLLLPPQKRWQKPVVMVLVLLQPTRLW